MPVHELVPILASKLKEERDRIAAEVAAIDRALESLNGNGTRRRVLASNGRSRKMSAAGRRRIARAQKARWAKWKREHTGKVHR